MQDSISRYEAMTHERQAGAFKVIVNTMLREGLAQTKDVAHSKLDAFFQWFSILPEGGRFQMTASVDKAWHAFVLNTEMYRNFCDRYIGQFVDHNPMDVISNTDEQKTEYARVTLARLQEVYGDRLHPLLGDLSQPVTCCCGCIVRR